MKSGIHPPYQAAKVSCACGHYSVDVCSECHPFYTGKQKLLDTAGRVDRFRRKYANVKKRA